MRYTNNQLRNPHNALLGRLQRQTDKRKEMQNKKALSVKNNKISSFDSIKETDIDFTIIKPTQLELRGRRR